MRYADGGDLTARERAARERVRLQAAEMFEQQLPTAKIAAQPRVAPKSVCAWRRTWTVGGRAGLVSRGPVGAVCKLDDAEPDRLAAELDRGPAAQEWAGFAAAHQQLHAPIVLIWHNLNTHVSRMRRFVAAHADWLTVIRRPAYAPDLNATESVWSHLERGLGNCAATGIDHLAAMVKSRLKRLQYRPDLLDGFLGQTGLILKPVPP